MAKLTPAQITKVSQWVAEGASLSVIQGKLSSELGISMTFLDVRFLVDDLNLTLQEKEEPKKPDEPVAETPAAEAAAADALEAAGLAARAGQHHGLDGGRQHRPAGIAENYFNVFF